MLFRSVSQSRYRRSGYRDFVGNFRQDLEEPYINLNTSSKLKKMASTGSLGDYLGLPTTIFGSYGQGAVAFLNTGVLRCPGNKAGGDPNYTMLEYLPIQNSDQYYSFVSKYGATVTMTLNGGISGRTMNSLHLLHFVLLSV